MYNAAAAMVVAQVWAPRRLEHVDFLYVENVPHVRVTFLTQLCTDQSKTETLQRAVEVAVVAFARSSTCKLMHAPSMQAAASAFAGHPVFHLNRVSIILQGMLVVRVHVMTC